MHCMCRMLCIWNVSACWITLVTCLQEKSNIAAVLITALYRFAQLTGECGTMSPAVRPSFLPDGSLIGTAPLPISSAPIAIPIRRNLDSNPTAATTSSTAASAASAAAQSAREKRNFKSAGDNAVGNSANPAAAPAITGDLEQQAAAGGDLQHQDHDNIETLSPVHDHANTANPANAKNSSLYSRDTGSIGNMSTFQVEKPSEEPKNSSLGSFFSFLGGSRANKSLSGRSTGDLSGSVGSYPTSPNSIGNSAGKQCCLSDRECTA